MQVPIFGGLFFNAIALANLLDLSKHFKTISIRLLK